MKKKYVPQRPIASLIENKNLKTQILKIEDFFLKCLKRKRQLQLHLSRMIREAQGARKNGNLATASSVLTRQKIS